MVKKKIFLGSKQPKKSVFNLVDLAKQFKIWIKSKMVVVYARGNMARNDPYKP